jgi:hypothetical protein
MLPISGPRDNRRCRESSSWNPTSSLGHDWNHYLGRETKIRKLPAFYIHQLSKSNLRNICWIHLGAQGLAKEKILETSCDLSLCRSGSLSLTANLGNAASKLQIPYSTIAHHTKKDKRKIIDYRFPNIQWTIEWHTYLHTGDIVKTLINRVESAIVSDFHQIIFVVKLAWRVSYRTWECRIW